MEQRRDSREPSNRRSEKREERPEGGRGGGGGERPKQLYVGGLPRGIREREIRERFQDYGDVVNVSIKGTYAFLVSITDSFHIFNPTFY